MFALRRLQRSVAPRRFVRTFAEAPAVEGAAAEAATKPPPKPKAGMFSRAKAFSGGFILSSGIAFYLLYFEVTRSSEVLERAVMDAAAKAVRLDARLSKLEARLNTDE